MISNRTSKIEIGVVGLLGIVNFSSFRVDFTFFFFRIWQVLEILSHVNKRVKHQHEIGLPLLSLWKLYTDSAAYPMVRNFAIVYVEMAFERAPAKVCSSHYLFHFFLGGNLLNQMRGLICVSVFL